MEAKPNTVNGIVTGSYKGAFATGSALTGLSAGDVLAFRWSDPVLKCLITSIRATLQVTVPFTAAQEYGIKTYLARSWTVQDTGGTAQDFTTGVGRLSVLSAASKIADLQVANAALLTPGTRTNDVKNTGMAIGAQIQAAASAVCPPVILDYEPKIGNRYPLVFAQNEGFVLASLFALGAGGSVRIACEVEWVEFNPFVG